MKFALLTFDVGGVLMSMDRDKVAREYIALAEARGAELGFDAAFEMFSALDDEIPARVRKVPPITLDDNVGEMFWKSLFRDGWARLGLESDDTSVNHLYALFRRGEFNRVFDDVFPTLNALRARGLRLGIISNFTSNLEKVLEELRLRTYFSLVVVSSLVRVEKPDRRIFDYAARMVVNPGSDRTVHVGDGLYADIEGARGADWGAILLDRDNWYPDYSTVPRIRTLTELIDLV